jgi:hypothetical protein
MAELRRVDNGTSIMLHQPAREIVGQTDVESIGFIFRLQKFAAVRLRSASFGVTAFASGVIRIQRLRMREAGLPSRSPRSGRRLVDARGLEPRTPCV